MMHDSCRRFEHRLPWNNTGRMEGCADELANSLSSDARRQQPGDAELDQSICYLDPSPSRHVRLFLARGFRGLPSRGRRYRDVSVALWRPRSPLAGAYENEIPGSNPHTLMIVTVSWHWSDRSIPKERSSGPTRTTGLSVTA